VGVTLIASRNVSGSGIRLPQVRDLLPHADIFADGSECLLIWQCFNNFLHFRRAFSLNTIPAGQSE
jgi:hypothetical protein